MLRLQPAVAYPPTGQVAARALPARPYGPITCARAPPAGRGHRCPPARPGHRRFGRCRFRGFVPKTAGPPAPRSPWPDAVQDQDEDEDEDQDEDQDPEGQNTPLATKPAPPAPAGTEVFEGVRIPAGTVHRNGGYVHCRKRREILAEASEIGIPAAVIHHKDLMADKSKPSARGYKTTEALIVQVREAQARGEDPASLWAQWVLAAPQPEPPPSPSKRGGGYVHPRTRKDMFAEGIQLGIPEAVLKHYALLRDGIKPTTQGFQTTEDLLTRVKAARATGQDPAPLWARWMPAQAAAKVTDGEDADALQEEQAAPGVEAAVARPAAVGQLERELAALLRLATRSQATRIGISRLIEVVGHLQGHYRAGVPATPSPGSEPAWADAARKAAERWRSKPGRAAMVQRLEKLLSLLPAPAATAPAP